MSAGGVGGSQQSLALDIALRDLGYASTSSPQSVKAVFNHVGITSTNSKQLLAEDTIAKVISMMCRTHSGLQDPADPSLASSVFSNLDSSEVKKLPSWDVETFVNVALETNPQLDWYTVLRQLDLEEFMVFDAAGLSIILNASKAALKDIFQFPISAFFGRWKNIKGQYSFLKQAVQSAPELFSFSSSMRRVISDPASVTSIKTISSTFLNQPWNSLDLIETLVSISESELYEDVKVFLEFSSQQSPELMLLGLSQIGGTWSTLHKELASNLVMMFLTGHPSSSFVLPLLWQFSQQLVIAGLIHMYSKDPTCLSRILDVAQEMKALSQILEAKPFSFAIDLAALASRRDYLNLEKWLQDRIRVGGNSFIKSCLDFLNEKVASQAMRESNSIPNVVPLSVDVVAIFIRILRSTSLTPENAELLKEILAVAVQAYPRLPAVLADDAANATTPSNFMSVENEANSFFYRLWNGELNMQQLVNLLRRYRDSTDQREQELYNFFTQVLFEEYKCFPTYPDRQLNVTGVLFGALIQSVYMDARLITSLRYVLDALRQPIGSKLFKFGTLALSQFQTRLSEWPQYCQLLLQIPHLHQAHPEITQFIKNLETQSITPPDAQGGHPDEASNRTPAAQERDVPQKSLDAPVFAAIKLDTLLEAADKEAYEIPTESIQDKILFIINNVTFANLDSKVAELKEILRDTHFRWFSHYLVVKRSSIEPNFHALYIAFLESLKHPTLHRNVLHETYSNIKVLLNSEKTVTSSSDRSLLNNLGTWLGGITLAKNRPIKHKNLAFKDLLLEGYDHERLIVVIPFVCKVLEQCSQSRVFKPPNPWLMAIIRLLAELYHFADLKLALQFPIEVLCKKIQLDIKDITPAMILRARPARSAAPPRIANGHTPVTTTIQPPPQPIVSQAPAQTAVTQVTTILIFLVLFAAEENMYPISLYISLSPSYPPGMRRIVHIAIDRAIKEILSPVIERSVTIAGMATRDLILKDFALEPKEEKMRKAANLMVQSLAGSLAAVSSREPLRSNMITQLRNLLLQNGYSEQSMPEPAVLQIVNENLDLACSIMEKNAAEKAVPEIDDILYAAYLARRKHPERSTQPYFDVSVYASSRYPSSLPDSLRLKPGGLTLAQLRVYEDFARLPRQVPPDAQERNARASRTEGALPPNLGVYEDNAAVTLQQIMQKLAVLLTDMDKLVAVNPELQFAMVPPQHEIRHCQRQILNLFSQIFSREDVLLVFTQKIVQQIYKVDLLLSRECYIFLLERIMAASKRIAKEVTGWLLYADDERKYNADVCALLIQYRLLNPVELDLQVARMIESGRTELSEFATSLLRATILGHSSPATYDNFFNIMQLLNSYVQSGTAPESVVETMRAVTAKFSALPSKDFLIKDDGVGLKEKLGALFLEWVRLYNHPSSSEKVQAAFVSQLQQHGVVQGEDISSLFFRTCTELSVDRYIKAKNDPHLGPSACFEAVDSFARLIVLLIRYYSEPSGTNSINARINLTTKVLSIIVLVLVHSHEQLREGFNQRPYFRLFSSLLNDLNVYEEHLQPLYFQILSSISNTFHTLQPSFLPGFTFAWLQLMSHRFFMPKLLLADGPKGWPFLQRLLVDLFKFLGPYLRQAEMSATTRLLYRASLRILLVLLHDFPEFLCDYHFSFVDVIPHSCIQLRNLILSAFPRTMRLPDPFTPNLKVDLLPEINQPPHVMSDYTSSLIPNGFKAEIDAYLKTRAPVNFLLELRSKLLLPPSSLTSDTSTKYNVPVINALVLYVGIQAIAQVQSKPLQGSAPMAHSAPMDIFQQLIVDLDTEGRYLFLSAMANQLRYPNSHTHYFSCVLLYLFAEASQEIIQEQITRVLIERLIVNRPHPYGLLITFIELIRNPRYNFWDHTSFIKCAPEIERLFNSVAKSIQTSLMRV
ncbi:hypothetical protein HDU76_001257 [Blyttiomyces sp. JEL0837]|nr:hypothetical protein HDU76_001257 [Blyttiomyces sp. JEL0837]